MASVTLFFKPRFDVRYVFGTYCTDEQDFHKEFSIDFDTIKHQQNIEVHQAENPEPFSDFQHIDSIFLLNSEKQIKLSEFDNTSCVERDGRFIVSHENEALLNLIKQKDSQYRYH